MTNFNSVNRIITAKDYGGSARAYIRKQQQAFHRGRGISLMIKDLESEPTGIPVYARVWQGQWIADCECNGACFVDPDEPVFFCFGCGNRSNDHKPRPVIFPPTMERLEIERLLLERPVDDMAGLTDMERAGMAKPLLYVEMEIQDAPAEPGIDILLGAGAGDMIPAARRTITVPLTRSWDPRQTIEDLHREQDDAVQKFRQDLIDGKAKRHVV